MQDIYLQVQKLIKWFQKYTVGFKWIKSYWNYFRKAFLKEFAHSR